MFKRNTSVGVVLLWYFNLHLGIKSQIFLWQKVIAMLVYCVTSTTASELICLRTRWAAQQCMYQLAVREYSEKKKINAPGAGVKIVWKTSIWYFKIFTINKENLSLWSATAMSKSRLPLGLTVALCRCCLCFSCQTSSHCPWSCIVRSQGLNKQKWNVILPTG